MGSPQSPQAGTGMGYSSPPPSTVVAVAAAAAPEAQTADEDAMCVASGLDSVTCMTPAEGGAFQASGRSATATEPETGPLGAIASTALLVSPFAFWGTSMVAMKGLLGGTPPLLMGALRLVPAGLVLVAWAQWHGRPQPSTSSAWAWVLLFALVDGAMFQGFLAEGLQRTSAGLGSVIIDSQPLTVAVLASVLFGERLGKRGVLALMVGVVGLLLLEVPQEQQLLTSLVVEGQEGKLEMAAAHLLAASSSSLAPGAAAEAVTAAAPGGAVELVPVGLAAVLQALSHPSSWPESGEFWMLLAAQSMAVGTIMIRYVTRHCDPVMATGWHMLLGGLLLCGMAAADDLPGSLQALDQVAHNPNALLGAVYVSLLGGAASYSIFYSLASSSNNLTRLSSLTFLTPVFAAAAGFLFLNETLTPMQLGGAAVTLASVLVINSRGKQQAQEQAQEQ